MGWLSASCIHGLSCILVLVLGISRYGKLILTFTLLCPVAVILYNVPPSHIAKNIFTVVGCSEASGTGAPEN